MALMWCVLGLGAATTIQAINEIQEIAVEKSEKTEVDQDYIVAITILGEARGEGEKGMKAVAQVILNRARERNRLPAIICLEPKQFSVWNDKKKGLPFPKDFDEKTMQFAMKVATMVNLNVDVGDDLVNGCNHFYSSNRPAPYWADKGFAKRYIGNHIFIYIPPPNHPLATPNHHR